MGTKRTPRKQDSQYMKINAPEKAPKQRNHGTVKLAKVKYIDGKQTFVLIEDVEFEKLAEAQVYLKKHCLDNAESGDEFAVIRLAGTFKVEHVKAVQLTEV